jgi:hypothetical protein
MIPHLVRLGDRHDYLQEFEAIQYEFQQIEIEIFATTMPWEFVEILRLDLCTFATS